jgi:hypothetical protein
MAQDLRRGFRGIALDEELTGAALWSSMSRE